MVFLGVLLFWSVCFGLLSLFVLVGLLCFGLFFCVVLFCFFVFFALFSDVESAIVVTWDVGWQVASWNGRLADCSIDSIKWILSKSATTKRRSSGELIFEALFCHRNIEAVAVFGGQQGQDGPRCANPAVVSTTYGKNRMRKTYLWHSCVSKFGSFGNSFSRAYLILFGDGGHITHFLGPSGPWSAADFETAIRHICRDATVISCKHESENSSDHSCFNLRCTR